MHVTKIKAGYGMKNSVTIAKRRILCQNSMHPYCHITYIALILHIAIAQITKLITTPCINLLISSSRVIS